MRPRAVAVHVRRGEGGNARSCRHHRHHQGAEAWYSSSQQQQQPQQQQRLARHQEQQHQQHQQYEEWQQPQPAQGQLQRQLQQRRIDRHMLYCGSNDESNARCLAEANCIIGFTALPGMRASA